MSYSDLLNKVEAAFARIVTDAGQGLNIYTGQDDTDDQTLPKAIVQAGQFTELFNLRMDGSFSGSVGVRIVTSAHDMTLEQHRAIVAAVFDDLSMDDLAATINTNETDFTVIGIGQMLQNHNNDENTRASEWGCELWCAPSDL